MRIKTERTKNSRVYTDPRVNMLGERVERVWEGPPDESPADVPVIPGFANTLKETGS